MAPHLLEPVLEIGAGTGLVALPLRRLGIDVVALDRSRSMAGAAALRLGDGVLVGDALALPLAAEAFGSVLAAWMLHQLPDLALGLREVARVLRPGGRLVVVASRGERGLAAAAELIAAARPSGWIVLFEAAIKRKGNDPAEFPLVVLGRPD